LNNQQSAVTNASGVASFSGVKSGADTVSVTDPGKKSAQTSFTLTPGQNKLVSFKLASTKAAFNYADLAYLGIVIVILLMAGGIWSAFNRRKLNGSSMANDQGVGLVVGGSDNDINVLPTVNTAMPQPVAPLTNTVDVSSPLPSVTTPETLSQSPAPTKIVSPQPTPAPNPTVAPDPTIIRPTKTPDA